jgi:hypothetical protein
VSSSSSWCFDDHVPLQRLLQSSVAAQLKPEFVFTAFFGISFIVLLAAPAVPTAATYQLVSSEK